MPIAVAVADITCLTRSVGWSKLLTMSKTAILIVDDERDTREYMARALSSDYVTFTAADAESALTALDAHPEIVLMLSDVRMPGADGMQLLVAAKKRHPQLACILLTAFGTVDQAVAAIKEGADDFIMKPVDLDQLDLRVAKVLKTRALEDEVRTLRSELNDQVSLPGLVGGSEALRKVFRLVRLAAPTQATVLVQGPSGTGKELIARALHTLSTRASGPFVAVNCGAIPENLIESELFGHVKGSFTGAVADKKGFFETANQGTLFLDEVGELPLHLQVKLLRALENRAIQRVGDATTIPVDIRVVAATNRDLRAAVAQGTFREDLFYRLNVVDVRLPPLREHVEDVGPLVRHFIAALAPQNGDRVKDVSPAALALLEAYAWPGNVRELRNVVERMLVFAPGPQLMPEDVPEEVAHPVVPEVPSATSVPSAAILPSASAAPVGASLAETEKARILAALREAGGNRTRAAQMLGISRRTIYRKLDEYAAEGEQV